MVLHQNLKPTAVDACNDRHTVEFNDLADFLPEELWTQIKHGSANNTKCHTSTLNGGTPLQDGDEAEETAPQSRGVVNVAMRRIHAYIAIKSAHLARQ